MKRRTFLGAAAGLVPAVAARGQSREKTLISLYEGGPNALDCQVPGANHSVYQAVWNCYDRLITFGLRHDEAGNDFYDLDQVTPEAVDDMSVSDLSITFRLKRDQTFHDGTVMTARDIKWSMDRSLGVGGVPKSQFVAVGITDPAQFVLVDDRTFRVDLARKDKMVMQSLGVPTAIIYNSQLVKSHATPADPWGLEWTRNNIAAGGAFKVDRWAPGQELVLIRNEDWFGGKKPDLQRVIARVVPSASTRRALLERGDADLSYDLPPFDAAEMSGNSALHVLGIPSEATVAFLSLNVKQPPFDNVKVRQAIACAIPYEKILDLALYRRARNLSGGPAKVTSTAWPQPGPYSTDITKARALMAEAGYPNGFESVLSFDVSAAAVNEPMCALIQEALAEIGVKVTLEKIPGANWRAQLIKKQMPMLTNVFAAWYPFDDYYFWQVYSGANTLFNTMNYNSPAMNRLIDDARVVDEKAGYERDCVGFIQLAFDDLPNIPLYQPYLNVAMRTNVSGFRYWFHREVDYRYLRKA